MIEKTDKCRSLWETQKRETNGQIISYLYKRPHIKTYTLIYFYLLDKVELACPA